MAGVREGVGMLAAALGAAVRVAGPVKRLALFAGILVLCGQGASAGVLPEDRADVLFHSYDGGGVTIEGPSVLVRKQFAKKFSASANYYVDKVSSASIDVVTTASPYTEERKQVSLGLDYLRDRWLMSIGLSNSEENDYSADTFNFNISQDMFGDLTTLSLGYTVGRDQVGRRGDPTFAQEVESQHYRLGLSQILTKNLLLGVSLETITDEGFLNNPYRSVRFADSTSPRGYSYEPEIYPRTRTSDAGSVRVRYYLPYRAALYAEYRSYTDTWAIKSSTAEIGYTHPLESGWVFDAKLRAYSQDKADFFSDLFPASQYQNFMARDKELSTFTSQGVRFGMSYDIVRHGWHFVERGTLNVVYDHLRFDYNDFRDLTGTGAVAGQEPLYGFDADVIQAFVSFWF
jgi:Protein of unknown function (DUF3570)